MLAAAVALSAALSAFAGTHAGQSPALSVAVVRDGAIVDDQTLGNAAANSRFPIGSVTKMFTAVSVMQLVEAKKIDLGAKVSAYLPDAPYANQITVRELLTHRSGLWNYGDEAFAKGWVSKSTTPQDILAIVARHPLDFAPGTKWSYSNSGYVVLGAIVERVAGEPLARYERDHIFVPAGMNETTVGFPAGGNVVAGYMTASGAPVPPWHPSWAYACGDIFSTAGDVARFDIALMHGTLLSRDAFASMQHTFASTPFGAQGLGIFMRRVDTYTLVGHHGGLPGYESENEMIPADGFAAVVLGDAFDFATGFAIETAIERTLHPVSAAATAEDLRATAKFRAALQALLDGTVDRSQYTPEAASALTPQTVSAADAQLRPFGSIASVKFLSERRDAAMTTYSFDVRFSGGTTMLWQFSVTPAGKIAAIGSSA